MLNHREYFDQIAERWDNIITESDLKRLSTIIQEIKIVPGSNILDVGTGTGVLIPMLTEAVGPQGKVTAMDFSPEMLKYARSKGPAEVEFVCADVAAIPYQDQFFDEVICNAVFPHFPDKVGAVKEILRVLKPGGRIVVCHKAGRETINQIHTTLGGTVTKDLIPNDTEMRSIFQEAGCPEITIENSPERYLLVAVKV